MPSSGTPSSAQSWVTTPSAKRTNPRGRLNSVLAATIMAYLPRILLALALATLAWIVATVVRSLVNRALNATRLDEKLSEGAAMPPVSSPL